MWICECIPPACNKTDRQPVIGALKAGQEAGPLQDDKVKMQRGQASVVIEIPSEQNLVCVIIVRQARNEAGGGG